MFEISNGLLEFDVQFQAAGQAAYAVGAGAIFVYGRLGCRVDLGMPAETQVTIAGGPAQLAAAHQHTAAAAQFGDGLVVIVEVKLLRLLDAVQHGAYALGNGIIDSWIRHAGFENLRG